jgi:hypothetical protein
MQRLSITAEATTCGVPLREISIIIRTYRGVRTTTSYIMLVFNRRNHGNLALRAGSGKRWSVSSSVTSLCDRLPLSEQSVM